jgi:excisionase family DNA binding protein
VRQPLLRQVEPTIPNDLVTIVEAAEIARVKRRTIWRRIRTGELTAWGSRRCYLVSLSEVLRPVRRSL